MNLKIVETFVLSFADVRNLPSLLLYPYTIAIAMLCYCINRKTSALIIPKLHNALMYYFAVQIKFEIY